MGLLGFLLTKKSIKAAGTAAADAWVADVRAALPAAQVSATTWAGRRYAGYGAFSTYTVQLRGNRTEFPALVGRLAAAIDALHDGDRLDLRIAESEAPGAVYSRMLLPGEHRDRAWVHLLVQTHDALMARLPGESLLIDGVFGRYTVPAVSRADAVATAREMISWWEELLAAELERWPLTGLSLEIGGSHDNPPEISYTVDLPGAGPEGDRAAVDKPAAELSISEKQQLLRLAVAGWNGSLDDLAAATRLTVQPGLALAFEFRPPKFQPRLIVLERATGTWKMDETAEMAAEVRRHNPASTLQVVAGR